MAAAAKGVNDSNHSRTSRATCHPTRISPHLEPLHRGLCPPRPVVFRPSADRSNSRKPSHALVHYNNLLANPRAGRFLFQ